jgi:hypothetical protein
MPESFIDGVIGQLNRALMVGALKAARPNNQMKEAGQFVSGRQLEEEGRDGLL